MIPKHTSKAPSYDISDTISSSSKLHSGSVHSYTTASTEESSSKRCQICHKSFILRRKITCQVCLNVFCSDHCPKKRAMPGSEDLLHICDACEEEETKKEIQEEIEAEIAKYSIELKELKETNEKLFREHFNKAGLVNDIEMEITKQEWNHKKQEQDLLAQLESEQNKGEKLRKLTDQLRNSLEDLNKSERFMADQCAETELQLESSKIEAGVLTSEKEEISSQIASLSQKLREGLSIEMVRKILCQDCLRSLNENLSKNGRISEDLVQAIKEYHRESLLGIEEKNKCSIV